MPPELKPAPRTAEVPLELCRDTIYLLGRLPLGEIYLLARRWEAVCPEFFTGQPPESNTRLAN